MLESILKRLLRRKVEQKVENVVEDALDSAFKSNPNAAQQAAPATPVSPSVGAANSFVTQTAPTEDDWDTEYNHDINYFRPILQANFPEYTIEENVPFAQIVPGTNFKYPPYTFVMRKNGQIALVISLQSKYSYKKGLHTWCEWKAQLKHINFFIEYPDRPEYVIDRVRQNLSF
jgi:hypothetical protein